MTFGSEREPFEPERSNKVSVNSNFKIINIELKSSLIFLQNLKIKIIIKVDLLLRKLNYRIREV